MLETLRAGSTCLDHKHTMIAGFPGMLLRNLDPFIVHVNCARYILVSVDARSLMLEPLTNDNSAKIFALTKMPCGPGDNNFSMPGFSRTQFGVRVYLAIKTKKFRNSRLADSQGWI